jgi:hypothetical protein
MYSIFQANKSGFLILFCIISNHRCVVIVALRTLVYIFNLLSPITCPPIKKHCSHEILSYDDRKICCVIYHLV